MCLLFRLFHFLIPLFPGVVRCRWLLGDERGGLWMVTLQGHTDTDNHSFAHLAQTDRLDPALHVLGQGQGQSHGQGHGRGQIQSIELFSLGRTVLASSISYLDNNCVYVGSRFGDPQLIRLRSVRVFACVRVCGVLG